MGDEEKKLLRRLETLPYRQVQRVAKSLDLPSNYKKIYLIQLINAKRYKTEEVVNNIINKVRLERLAMRTKNTNKLLKLNNGDTKHSISKSRTSFSPPITMTPKGPRQVFTFSPDVRNSVIKHNPRRSILLNLKEDLTPKPISCDRVLRSFNLKNKRPNYAFMESNGGSSSHNDINKRSNYVITELNDQNSNHNNVNNKGVIRTLSHIRKPKVVTAKCVIKNFKPVIMRNNFSIERPLALAQNMNLVPSIPLKRQRTLSGIYPLVQNENIPKIPEEMSFRRKECGLSIINALTEEIIPNQNNNHLQIEYPGSNNYPAYSANYREDYCSKIRVEQDMYQRRVERNKLPKISDVFTRFNNIHMDSTQPLYVQVNTEAERSQLYTHHSQKRLPDLKLEKLYNFRRLLNINNLPLKQITSSADTECVYSTSVRTTAMAQQSTSVINDAYHLSLLPDNCMNDADASLSEFLGFTEQQHNNLDYNRSNYSSETYNGLETPATIPEMVEDALEIISQDGDYMERIGMDTRIQCWICSWAGPKIILEHHLRRDHGSEISRASRRVSEVCSEWSARYTVGALVEAGAWLSRLLDHDTHLYLLSAKYDDPDSLMLTLTCLSTENYLKLGTITVYNRLSGEPFTWHGYIQPLPPNLPFENPVQCLKLDISKLVLLPNSANLKLLNRKLVTNSLSKVIVGPPALDDIHIVVFVKIFA